jgi:hypothetical protein
MVGSGFKQNDLNTNLIYNFEIIILNKLIVVLNILEFLADESLSYRHVYTHFNQRREG